MLVTVIINSMGSAVGPKINVIAMPSGIIPTGPDDASCVDPGYFSVSRVYDVPNDTTSIIIRSVEYNCSTPGVCNDYIMDIMLSPTTSTSTSTSTSTTSTSTSTSTSTTSTSTSSSTTTTTTTSGPVPPTSTSTSTTTSSTSSTTSTTTTSTSSSSTTTTSTTVECPDCYWYDLYCDGQVGESSVFDMVECNGTVVEQSVPYEANGTMIFCLQNDPVIRPLGIPGHFIKGEICGNVCDTTTSTSSSSTTTTSTTVECPDCYWYDLYSDEESQSAVFDMVECNGTIVEQSVPYEANPMTFCLQSDPINRQPGVVGHFVKGETCGNTCDTTTTSTTSSTSSTTTTSTTIECPDCYYYDLYCDGVEGESSLFAYRDCSGQYEEQTVPYEASPWTLCSTVLPESIGAIPGHVMGGSVVCTTTTSTTAP